MWLLLLLLFHFFSRLIWCFILIFVAVIIARCTFICFFDINSPLIIFWLTLSLILHSSRRCLFLFRVYSGFCWISLVMLFRSIMLIVIILNWILCLLGVLLTRLLWVILLFIWFWTLLLLHCGFLLLLRVIFSYINLNFLWFLIILLFFSIPLRFRSITVIITQCVPWYVLIIFYFTIVSILVIMLRFFLFTIIFLCLIVVMCMT